MKNKHLLGFLIFLAVLFAGDRIISYFCFKALDKSGFRYVRMYNNKIQSDIVIMGNSRGRNAFYEPYLKEKSQKDIANLSFRGLESKLALTLLSDYIEEIHTPKLAVVEISMLFNEPVDPLQLAEFKLFSDKSKRLNVLIKEELPTTYYFKEIFHLNHFNSEFFLRNLFYIGKSDVNKQMNFVINDFLIQKTKEMKPIEIKVNQKSLDLFLDFKKRAEKKGIEVRLFSAPYLPAYKKKLNNFNIALNQIEAATQLKVYDFTEKLTETNLFADRIHNNQPGAEKLADMTIAAGLFD